MNIRLGNYTLLITLSDNTLSWEQQVIQEVEKMGRLYPEHYGTFGGRNIKIARIKAVCQLASMFPEDIREHSGVHNPLSLIFCKDWVEDHWQNNGYGDPVK